MSAKDQQGHAPRPPWLRTAAPRPGPLRATAAILDAHHVHTVCREARCPNRNECYASGTATFLVLGSDCTRRCRFCAVGWGSATPGSPDAEEPRRIADAVVRLGLRHAIVTSVTRDDLEDGGAEHVAAVVLAIRAAAPAASVEVLVSDMNGDETALRRVLAAGPDVVGHNLETVPRLAPRVRPGASYPRSLRLLRAAAASRGDRRTARVRSATPLVKTGLMVGLGESLAEVCAVISECARAGVDILTIGQYLRPHSECVGVRRYVPPDEFAALARHGSALGLAVQAGPLVRSSYHAAELLSAASGDAADYARHGDASV